MKATSIAATCPRCGGSGGRCTGCGVYYRNTALGCIGTTCRTAAAAYVCRCGRVHTIAS